MIRRFIAIALILLVWNMSAQVANYNIGDVVDNFTVTDTNGNSHTLYDITAQGKYVYLDFFFDTCPPCYLTQAIFNEFHDKYGCNEGELYMISINNGTDTNAEVMAFEEAYGGTFRHAPAVGIEGGCAAVDENFGVFGYPSYLLISPNNVYLSRVNEIPHTVADFEATFPVDFNPLPMACSPLGVENHNNNLGLILFPNPTKSLEINIQWNDFSEDTKIKIYSILGELLYENIFSEPYAQIKTPFPVGNYIVKATSKRGTEVLQFLIN